MSINTMNLPANANVVTPLSEDVGGTGVSNALGHTLTINGGAVTLVAQSGGSTLTLPTSATIPSSVQNSANIKGGALTWTGGSTSHSFTITGLTASSIVVVELQSYTNPADVLAVQPGSNSVGVIFSADPGACTLSYIALVAPQ